MKYNIKFCKNCYKNGNSLAPQNTLEYYAGYMVCMKAEKLANMTKCPLCGYDGLIEKNITEKELDIIGIASDYNRQLLDAMIDLKEKNIIEYELKMTQFRNQVEQQKSNAAQVQNNLPKCPTCGSTNIKKISASRKMLGAIGFGLLSKTARSQWECNNCGNKW